MKKAGGSNHLVGSCVFLTHLLYLDQAPEHEYTLRHTYGTDGAQANIDSCFLCLTVKVQQMSTDNESPVL